LIERKNGQAGNIKIETKQANQGYLKGKEE
jgi:hypothetical protein